MNTGLVTNNEMVYSSGASYDSARRHGIRPIVLLESNINLSGGAGTLEEPYQIQ